MIIQPNKLTMKKHNDQPIKDILKGLVHQGPLQSGYYDAKVKQIWSEKLGKLILQHTDKIHLSNNIIYLKLNSAPLRNELLMGKKQLIENFNKELGSHIVQDIIFK